MSEQSLPQLSAEIRACRILVVDDTDYSRHLIGHFLNTGGWHDIFYATNGPEALTLYKQKKPDIILLDVTMPQMDGLEVCRIIRHDEGDTRIPILIQTAHTDISDRAKAFDAGATDFLSKPLYQYELIARVRIHLENRLLIRKLQSFRDRLDGELSVARLMQDVLLPGAKTLQTLQDDKRISIASYYQPTSELAGDSWSVSPLYNDQLSLFITDLSGHGVTAAINAFRLHTMINLLSSGHDDPGAMLTTLNVELHRDFSKGQFAAMTYARIDFKEGLLHYASAAMPYAILCHGDTGALQLLDQSSLPLAIRQDTVYETHSVSFPEGSLLFLYSDAAIESQDKHGTYLEISAMQKWLGDHQKDASPQNIIDAFIAQLFGQERLDALSDDLTLVCLRYQKP